MPGSSSNMSNPRGGGGRDRSPAPSLARSIPRPMRSAASTSSAPRDDDGPQSANSSTGTVRKMGMDQDPSTVPSSFESFNTAHTHEQPQYSSSSASQTVHEPPRVSRTSSRASLRERRDAPSPDRAGSTRRPPAARRISSAAQPHRGQEFSAEDEVSEVEEDWDNKQRAYGPYGSTGYSSMRRRSQLLRRRGTQPGGLPTMEDVVDEDPVSEERAESVNEGIEDTGDEEEQGTVRGGGSYASSEAESVESFTLKDRQQAINETHPFGIRIWKPALYKKDRSVQKTAEGDIHSAPGGSVGPLLFSINILWVLLFGWWLAAVTLVAGLMCYIIPLNRSTTQYGKVLLGLAGYLLYPFGRFVELQQDETYAEEDEGEGRSISEYEQWQSGDIETGRTFFGPHTPASLIGRRRESLDSASESESLIGTGERTGLLSGTVHDSNKKVRFFGRGQWTLGRVLFYLCFYFVIAPLLLLVSGLCWMMVFWIPMAKVTYLLVDHLRRHPLALSFHSDRTYSRRPGTPSSSILLCTYRAVGWKYYKYTVDGTNIFFINLIGIVIFVIADHFLLAKYLGIKNAITEPAFVFTLSLFSVIPLAYFIGQAVASISAQSSMGMGATINAFFSTIVEVYLYCVALTEGKSALVEGSIMGSIFAGVVFMPGLSMCSGAIKRKTQRFNARSAGVTSTMLLFAIIAAFSPTLFYQVYGTYELSCHACEPQASLYDSDCRRCSFHQTPPTANDHFFKQAVQPYTYIAAAFLFISYLIGLWFTLRTHAAVIWQASPSAPQHHDMGPSAAPNSRYPDGGTIRGAYDGRTPSLRDSQLYKRILGQSLNTMGMRQDGNVNPQYQGTGTTPHLVPPRSSGEGPTQEGVGMDLSGLTTEQNAHLVRGVAEMAAAAATVAMQDVQRGARKNSTTPKPPVTTDPDVDEVVVAAGHGGGHDAPNWGKVKSAVILLGATVLYAIVAEILVNTVDVVLDNFNIDEKFLGITLFALVPNTTEFLNAISFAMNGNIALSMEIGSAYALQVCLLQIPALVAFSAFYGPRVAPDMLSNHTFSLIFPQWDLVTVILCVFLLAYMYGEGKSNYFKGSILLLSYLTIIIGFYFASFASEVTSSQVVMLGSGNKAGYFLRPT